MAMKQPWMRVLCSTVARTLHRRRRAAEINFVTAECEAYLSGKYADWLSNHGQPVPGWAWINGLAHGSADDVTATAAADAGGEGPDQLIAEIACKVRSATEGTGVSVAALQHHTLIPLETRLWTLFGDAVPTDSSELAEWLALAFRHPTSPR
ncbi:MAG: hypothetical protein J2P57_00200 [Acidimicrobiaceae bacterium]|nr:hypothetical protein [Acidimicrobiaceae bacterium]